jgi:hypothetical protein
LKKSSLLTTALVFIFLLPVNSQASFLSDMMREMGSVANNMVDGMTSTSNNMVTQAGNTASGMMDLMSKLSDDIGLMADRIGVMADRIGEMADRIVETEQLMADMVVELQENTFGNNDNDQTTSVILLTESGTTVFDGEIPEISTSDQSNEYQLFVSKNFGMDSNTVSFLIKSHEDLEELWPTMTEITNSEQLYIAVKTITGNTISNLSNSVLINLQ